MMSPIKTICYMLVILKTKKALLSAMLLFNWKTKTTILRTIDKIYVIFVDLYIHKYVYVFFFYLQVTIILILLISNSI